MHNIMYISDYFQFNLTLVATMFKDKTFFTKYLIKNQYPLSSAAQYSKNYI